MLKINQYSPKTEINNNDKILRRDFKVKVIILIDKQPNK